MSNYRDDRRRERDDDRKRDRDHGGDRDRDDRRRDPDHRRRGAEEHRSDRRRSRERDDRRRDEESKRSSRRSSRSPAVQRKRDVAPPKLPTGTGPRNLRIDRHECRKAAIDFLVKNPDITDRYSNERIESAISDYIRTLEMEYDYYSFTVEILKGLLIDRKYTVITDRWVMGILDDHLQAELKVSDLTILRVAGFELLTHPEIPTTVVINEVNVLAKMYCPEKQSLIHAGVNRMIETQASIGNELAFESGEGRRRGKDDPMQLLVGLDQESQLAMLLLDQMRRKKKKEKRSRSHSSDSSSSSRKISPSPKRTRPAEQLVPQPVEEAEDISFFTTAAKPIGRGTGGIKIAYTATFDVPKTADKAKPETTAPKPVETKINASTQTVKDPLIEPGVRVFRITMYL